MNENASKHTMKGTSNTEHEADRIEQGLKEQIGTDQGFSVPKNYFSELEEDLSVRVAEIEGDKRLRIRKLRLAAFAAAASIAILLSVFFLRSTDTNPLLVEIEEPVLDEFYFDVEVLEELALEEDAFTISEVSVEMDEFELAQYFEDNGVSIDELLEDI